MRASCRLLQHATRITLFTRNHCPLCDDARAVLARVWETRPFAFEEVDIIQPENRAWRDLYDMDVPVIHVSDASTSEDPTLSSRAVKLMHRFRVEEVLTKMDEIGGRGRASECI